MTTIARVLRAHTSSLTQVSFRPHPRTQGASSAYSTTSRRRSGVRRGCVGRAREGLGAAPKSSPAIFPHGPPPSNSPPHHPPQLLPSPSQTARAALETENAVLRAELDQLKRIAMSSGVHLPQAGAGAAASSSSAGGPGSVASSSSSSSSIPGGKFVYSGLGGTHPAAQVAAVDGGDAPFGGGLALPSSSAGGHKASGGKRKGSAAAAGAHGAPAVPSVAPQAQSTPSVAASSAAAVAAAALSADSIWNIGPLDPSSDESSVLRSFFDHCNRMLPAVDEESFYTALREASDEVVVGAGVGDGEADGDGVFAATADITARAQQHQPAPTGRGGRRSDGGAGPPVSSAPPPSSSAFGGAGASSAAANLANIALNSEAYGFRVLFHTVLCAGAKVQGRARLARHHYELARAYIGPCFSVPSQHLVSALLVMTMITRALCGDSNQSSLHAALAIRMADLVPVMPEVRTVAVLMHYANNVSGRMAAPPPLPPPPPPAAAAAVAAEAAAAAAASGVVNGVAGAVVDDAGGGVGPWGPDPHRRFADILGYVLNALYFKFAGIDTQGKAGAFLRLLDSAVDIQESTRVMRNFPLGCISAGVSAILYARFGQNQLAMDKMGQCVRLALADPMTRYSVPVLSCIKEMLPLARDILSRPEFAHNGGEIASSLRKDACTFLGSADLSIQAAAGVHVTRLAHCREEAAGGKAEAGDGDGSSVGRPAESAGEDPSDVQDAGAAGGSSACPCPSAPSGEVSGYPSADADGSSGQASSSATGAWGGGGEGEGEGEGGCPGSSAACPDGKRRCPKTGAIIDASLALASSFMKGPGFDGPTTDFPGAVASPASEVAQWKASRAASAAGRPRPDAAPAGTSAQQLLQQQRAAVQVAALARMTATLMPPRRGADGASAGGGRRGGGAAAAAAASSFSTSGAHPHPPPPASSASKAPSHPPLLPPGASATAVPLNLAGGGSRGPPHVPAPLSLPRSQSIPELDDAAPSPEAAESGQWSGKTHRDLQAHRAAAASRGSALTISAAAATVEDDLSRLVRSAYGDLSAEWERQPDLPTPQSPTSYLLRSPQMSGGMGGGWGGGAGRAGGFFSTSATSAPGSGRVSNTDSTATGVPGSVGGDSTSAAVAGRGEGGGGLLGHGGEGGGGGGAEEDDDDGKSVGALSTTSLGLQLDSLLADFPDDSLML
jgi:hypothetical protein